MIKQISLVNRSGHTLRGILDFPEKEPASSPSADDFPAGETVPVLIHIHGFGGTLGGYKGLHTHLARTLAKSGIACVRFDMYGNGESDGEFSDMTFTSLLEDTGDIFHWVEGQDWADKEHIFLAGQSMGGYVAACAAPRLSPSALVLLCPGAGMWQGALERSLALEARGIFSADVEGLCFSTAFNKDLHQYEPFSSAAGYTGPVLLIRGTRDELVDDATCKKYCDVYGDTCTYLTVENGNHNFASIPAREACEAAIINFLKN